MRRGTTPDFILTVNADLSGKKVFVTLSQPRYKCTLTGDKLSIAAGEDESVIAFRLQQKNTLGLTEGKADVQVRFIDENGIAKATQIKQVDITRVLLERVIQYDE